MHSFRLYSVLLLSSAVWLRAQAPASPDTSPPPADQPPVELEKFVVTGQLDRAREDIVPSLGATSYELTALQITALPQGADASFSQVLLRVPGVAQDSGGQVHLRGEHANLQYRINDVLLPEGISGFGSELDTRFVDTLSVLTGSLPAQYGYRTSGVVDIHTKSGGTAEVSELSVYGGEHERFRPSFEFGGSQGRVDYYLNGSYDTHTLGIDNPTGRRDAIHDRTEQAKGFGYFSVLLDATSRLNLIVSGSTAKFQIPNNPDQAPAFTLPGVTWFDSATLDENQRESNRYVVVAYQKTLGAASMQAVAFIRTSRVHFLPDPVGDLVFNGVASDVQRDILSNGVELDARWALADTHTLRGGLLVTADRATTATTTAVFAADADGNQASATPFSIADRQRKRGYLYGVYAQDEWKLSDRLTLNYGLRADGVEASTREGQLSPRLNAVYKFSEATSLHAGYARYFTPPPLELLQASSIAQFNGTTNASEVTASSPVRSERSHYFDLGMSHKVSPALALSLDSYYKMARHQLDEGQFGRAIILSPFNYRTGEVYGAEFSANYTQGKFAAYANLALSRATGRDIVSGEFQFGPDELAYIATHDVYLDHDQRYTASTGVSYAWHHTQLSADLLYGSGLRRGFANREKLPAYHPFNLGIEHTFTLAPHRQLRARLDVVNVFDEVYELRDGSGIGVGAPQFGERRGIYGGLAWAL
jgi:outer membrane receptor protein involved in Fe transport